MKRILLVLGALVVSAGVLMAEEKEWKNHVPEVGSVSLGMTFNVASLATQMPARPDANTHLGNFFFDAKDGLFMTPASMYILSQDPVAAIRVKWRMTEHWTFRASVGLNGSHLDYSEYVRDDLAFSLDPNSENKVVDHLKADLNSTNFAVGAEFTAGPRNLKFVCGVNLLYAFAGGKMKFDYGNAITSANPIPTTVIGAAPAGTKYNDFPGGMGIVWNDELDLSCDELFANGVEIQTPFDGLLAFTDATELWGLNESTLRKAIAYGKLVKGVDACKYGKQWVISMDAMKREYGEPKNI